MTDLRPAQDVALEILGCTLDIWGRNCRAHHRIFFGGEINPGWPCPELIRVTALIKADRKAAMAKAWDEGVAVNLRRTYTPWGDESTNPYEAAHD